MTDIATGTDDSIVPIFFYAIGGIPKPCCDARTLHAYLGTSDEFADWFKARVEKYGFEENSDFSFVSVTSEEKNKGRRSSKNRPDQNQPNYRLTMYMAKELSLAENSKKGKVACRFFECEIEKAKTTGEMIVEMLCDGKTVKQIEAELEISHHTLEERLRVVQSDAGLPRDKRTYKARKVDILENIKKWNEYKKQKNELKQRFRASLVDFDF